MTIQTEEANVLLTATAYAKNALIRQAMSPGDSSLRMDFAGVRMNLVLAGR